MAVSPSYRRINRAVRAKKLRKQELEAAVPRQDLALNHENSRNKDVEAQISPLEPFQVPLDRSEVQLTAARLYGQGFKRPQIARALLHHIVPNATSRNEEQRLASARLKLKRWEMSQEFRDLVYKHAVVDLDMSTPAILMGLSRSAKRGRVDAARLVLELTGRHSKEDGAVPTQVTVNLLNVARPG